MHEGDESKRVMLRAEIRSSKETIVALAREVTKRGIFVVTDWLPAADTDVELRLSLPSIIEPTEVRARVLRRRSAVGVGDLGGVELMFLFDSVATRDRVAAVVDRLAAQRAARLAERRTYRVLLVEDNAFIRDMFAYGMDKFFQKRSSSLELEHVEDAASAWTVLTTRSFDLVIVDYYLPAEDGAHLIARLRKETKLAKVPVVAISVGGRDARDATISAGADLFLDKPVVLRDLFDTLQLLSTSGGLS